MLNEADIIRSLQKKFAAAPGVPGISDDAAVLPLNDRENYVVTKDILVEHKHFRLGTTGSASLGRKALHVNLSDIAAMGAEPLYVLLGIALPPNLENDWIEKFLAGFTSACLDAKVHLIGGDTTASDRDLFISVTIIGRAKKNRLKFRSGAKAGDIICVAGELGEAHAGLIALEKNVEGLVGVKSQSLRPLALVEEGRWLGAQKAVTAMMDVSDGLYIDLSRLLQASKRGGAVNLESLKPSSLLQEACRPLKLDVRECMLTGGEDYALLMTIDATGFEKAARAFEKKFGYSLLKIGTVTSGKKLQLLEKGKPVPFTYRPFSHFGEI